MCEISASPAGWGRSLNPLHILQTYYGTGDRNNQTLQQMYRSSSSRSCDQS